MAIERKSAELYNALMAAYDKKPDEVLVEDVKQHEAKEEVKLKDFEALKIIQKGLRVSNLNKYEWGEGHRELVDQWNAAINNKDKEKVKSAASGVTWKKLPQAITQVKAIKK